MMAILRDPTDTEWNAMVGRGMPPPVRARSVPQKPRPVSFADTSVQPMETPSPVAPQPTYVQQYREQLEAPARQKVSITDSAYLPRALTLGDVPQALGEPVTHANAGGPTPAKPVVGPDESGYSQLAQPDVAPIPQKINYATYGSGFMMRDAMRGLTTPGTQMESNYGYGDTITATADRTGRLNQFSGFNPLPGSAPGAAGPAAAAVAPVGPTAQRLGMAPGLGGELHAARMAALGGGAGGPADGALAPAQGGRITMPLAQSSGADQLTSTSGTTGTMSTSGRLGTSPGGLGYDVGGGGERMPEQPAAIDTSHPFDQTIAMKGASGDVFDQWQARRMAKTRDMDVARRLEGVQAQTGQQQARTAQQQVAQAMPLERMRQEGARYGHELTREGQRDIAAAHRYGSELTFAPHAAEARMKGMQLQALRENRPEDAERIGQVLHPHQAAAEKPIQHVVGPDGTVIALNPTTGQVINTFSPAQMQEREAARKRQEAVNTVGGLPTLK